MELILHLRKMLYILKYKFLATFLISTLWKIGHYRFSSMLNQQNWV